MTSYTLDAPPLTLPLPSSAAAPPSPSVAAPLPDPGIVPADDTNA